MDKKVKQSAAALAQALEQSMEYRQYREAKELAFQSAPVRALYEEYKRAQVQLQAAALTGRRDELQEKRLEHLAALLYEEESTSALLLAEYALQQVVAEVYRTLAKAVDLDMAHLEE